MPELPLVQPTNRLVERINRGPTFTRDTRRDDSAISRVAFAADEASGLEAVDQSRDVGIAIHHANADLAKGKSIISGTAENTQHVVLRLTDVCRSKLVVELRDEKRRCPKEIDERFSLGTTERLGLLDLVLELGRHGGRMLRVAGA